MIRKIDLIVIHCSATRADRSLTPDDLETQHRRRGFNGTGYHHYIRKDGTVHQIGRASCRERVLDRV